MVYLHYYLRNAGRFAVFKTWELQQWTMNKEIAENNDISYFLRKEIKNILKLPGNRLQILWYKFQKWLKWLTSKRNTKFDKFLHLAVFRLCRF